MEFEVNFTLEYSFAQPVKLLKKLKWLVVYGLKWTFGNVGSQTETKYIFYHCKGKLFEACWSMHSKPCLSHKNQLVVICNLCRMIWFLTSLVYYLIEIILSYINYWNDVKNLLLGLKFGRQKKGKRKEEISIEEQKKFIEEGERFAKELGLKLENPAGMMNLT